MAALDAGPASGNSVLFFNTNGGGGVEVHVGAAPANALNPLPPSAAPYQSDPQSPYTGTVVNKLVAGNIQVSIPA